MGQKILLIDSKVKRPKVKCHSNQNNKWHAADKHPRGKYDISLKQIIFLGTVLNDEKSIEDCLKKKGIYLSKTYFVLHSKLKFEIVALHYWSGLWCRNHKRYLFFMYRTIKFLPMNTIARNPNWVSVWKFDWTSESNI